MYCTNNNPNADQQRLTIGLLGKNKIYVDKLNTTYANGVTYTINNDGTVTVNGTPSGTSPSYVVAAMQDGSSYKDFSQLISLLLLPCYRWENQGQEKTTCSTLYNLQFK